jgi:hypothetical protein
MALGFGSISHSKRGRERGRHTWWVLVAGQGPDEDLGTWRRAAAAVAATRVALWFWASGPEKVVDGSRVPVKCERVLHSSIGQVYGSGWTKFYFYIVF